MESLDKSARAFGIELDSTQLAAFENYYRELSDWNTRVNLTAITERDQVMVKHFLDALSIAPLLQPADHLSVVDLGAGAGLPGVPLKIALPALSLTLVDATRKKVDFLKHLIARLDLKNVTALQSRAEDLGQDPACREQYDVALARAVADLPILLEYALPLVRVGGLFIASKGIEVEDEVRRSTRALKTLGGRVREIVPVQLPALQVRHLIVVEKKSRTPSAYPRRAGIPEREPLL